MLKVKCFKMFKIKKNVCTNGKNCSSLCRGVQDVKTVHIVRCAYCSLINVIMPNFFGIRHDLVNFL